MLDRLKAMFSAPEASVSDENGFAPDDARVAVAALLVHMTRIDGVVTADETQTVNVALESQFGLDQSALQEIVDEATRRDDEAVDLYGFTSVLKAKLDESERADVIELLWETVFADGVVNELEDNMVWRTAELLGVSSRDRMILRKKVAEKAASGG